MKGTFLQIKKLLSGKWTGEGFAKFPTIEDTAYTEKFECISDEYKDAIFFQQKTWYKNDKENNGHTVFWDTGFFILKNNEILLLSVQVGGRIEEYILVESTPNTFIFNSYLISNDPKSTKSQRLFTISFDTLHYELNMKTHDAGFQNHLKADLKKILPND